MSGAANGGVWGPIYSLEDAEQMLTDRNVTFADLINMDAQEIIARIQKDDGFA